MRHGLCLFLLLAALYTLTLGGHLYSPDEEILFRTTEALATRGSLAVEPLLGFATRPAEPRRADGREYAQYGIGQPLAAVPLYWVGRCLGATIPDEAWFSLLGRMRTEYPRLEPPVRPEDAARETAPRLGVSLFNLFVTALSGVVLFGLILRLGAPERAAWLAALAWGAGSMAWPHARTFFTEPLAGLCLLATLYLLARFFHPRDDAPSPGGGRTILVFAAGCFAAYGCLVRVDSIVFLPPLALLAVFSDAPSLGGDRTLKTIVLGVLRHGSGRRVLARLALFALPALVAGCLILWLNRAHFGDPLASGYSDQPEGVQFSTPLLAGLYGFTMSVGKGMFFFSPVLVLGLWGVGSMLRRRPIFGSGLVLVFLAFLFFQCTWRNWGGGWDWGPRHIMQLHALLAIPLGFWLARALAGGPGRRILFKSLFIVSIGVQVYGSSQNPLEFFRLFYQDPRPPRATALYAQPSILALPQYDILLRERATGRTTPIAANQLPAPLNDHVYILQNSQWYGYAAMQAMGIHDFFWLHVLACVGSGSSGQSP